jgi:DNA polymerase-3 subunit delta'
VIFNDIIGQPALKERLIRSVKDQRISHAQLFFGPEGAGSLALALAYAQYIACTGVKEDDACGTCPSCIKYGKLVHPDLHFVFPVNSTATKDNPLCDDFLPEWRSFVLQQPYGSLNDWFSFIELENKQGLIKEKESDAISKKLALKSFESDFKIAIVWMAEKMNDSASNKLLKLLEEPPDMTLFILISEDPEQLLPTIRSRCFPVKVPPVSEEDLTHAMESRHGANPLQAETITRLAAGNYLKAMELMRENDEKEDLLSAFREFMLASYQNHVESILKMAENLNALTRERQKAFLGYCLRIIRENAMKHFGNPGLNYMNPAEEAFSIKFSAFISGRNLVQLNHELNRAYHDIERNGNAKMIFLDLSLKVGKLLRQ